MAALAGPGMIEGGRVPMLAHEAIAPCLRVKHHSTVGEVAIAGDEACIGTALTRAYADQDPITVYDIRSPGVQLFVCSGAITAGATVSSVAGGKVQTGSGGAVTIGVALSTTAGNGELVAVMVAYPVAVATGLRANITQEDLVAYPISLESFYLWDSTVHAPLGATALTADDLIYVLGAPGTNVSKLKGTDPGGTSSTQYGVATFTLPPEYVAGQTIKIRVNGLTGTTVSDDTSLVDFNVYREDAPTVDICGTAAQTINSLTAVDADFVITPTDCVPGDLLILKMAYIGHDTGNAGAMVPTINSVKMLLDIKG